MHSGLDRFIVIVVFLIVILFFFLFGFFIFNYVKPDEQSYQLGLAITFLVIILSLINHRVGLYAFTISVGISPELIVMDTPNFRIEDLLFPIICFSWFTYFLKEKKEFVRTGLTAPAVAFLGISTISYLMNIGLGNLNARAMKIGFYELGKTFQYFLIFLIFANSFDKKRELKQAIFVLIVSFFISGISAIIVKQQSGLLYGPQGEGPNIIGGYYSLSLCILIGLLATLSDPVLWILLLTVSATVFYPLVYTLSRTSYVSFVCGTAIVGIVRAKKILLWLILFFAVALSMQDHPLFERATSIFYIFTHQPPSSWEARVAGWQVYSQYFFRAPILGNGTGFTPRTIDNEYVKVLVDKGLLGLLAFVWLIISYIIIAVKIFRTEIDDKIIQGFSLGFLAATISISIHSIGAVSFTVIRVAQLYYILLGLSVAALNFARKEVKEAQLVEEKVTF